MTKEWINQKIKEAHENAVENGFYPDGEEKNIGELLMLVVSELGEALEAHRCGRFADNKQLERFLERTKHPYAMKAFKENIKDTFEDEIADVFIRLFDLCGYLVEEENYDVVLNNYEQSYPNLFQKKNIGEFFFFFITDHLSGIGKDLKLNYIPAGAIGRALSELKQFCGREQIPIQKHIEAKMAYNKTRPRLHGKEY